MISYFFWKKNIKRVLNIGIVGGWIKVSIGFIFRNLDKKFLVLVVFF